MGLLLMAGTVQCRGQSRRSIVLGGTSRSLCEGAVDFASVVTVFGPRRQDMPGCSLLGAGCP